MLELYLEYDQSIWLDHMDRGLLLRGDLRLLVSEGLRGVSSNPGIFYKAISNSAAYDDLINELLQADHDMDDATLYEQVIVSDAQLAADFLEPVYVSSEGHDGFVSFEVSPHLAFDTPTTLEAARHLWRSVNRANLMIKIPATEPGVSAIEQLIAEGINVNATLLFSLDRYRAVADAYIRGLSQNKSPETMASVASFFISRIDAKVDAALDVIDTPEAIKLKGRVAIANAKMAFLYFKKAMASEAFEAQKKRGAAMQRVLWSDTSNKNPDYAELYYVEQLIGPATVSAMSSETLQAFQLRGNLRDTLESDVEGARQTLETLTALGIDLDKIMQQLEKERVKKFADSYDQLLVVLKQKRLEISRELVHG
ncbi:MAG: transaldolase [Gammaproteobacteria bacterium]|nr:transaldolase [Gammaproteobacteria bacterium]